MSTSVYKHTFPNGKVYIGISDNPLSRWNNGAGYSDNPDMYSDIRKFGWDNIKHEILKSGLSREDALSLEEKLIIFYDSENSEKGYNRTCFYKGLSALSEKAVEIKKSNPNVPKKTSSKPSQYNTQDMVKMHAEMLARRITFVSAVCDCRIFESVSDFFSSKVLSLPEICEKFCMDDSAARTIFGKSSKFVVLPEKTFKATDDLWYRDIRIESYSGRLCIGTDPVYLCYRPHTRIETAENDILVVISADEYAYGVQRVMDILYSTWVTVQRLGIEIPRFLQLRDLVLNFYLKIGVLSQEDSDKVRSMFTKGCGQ